MNHDLTSRLATLLLAAACGGAVLAAPRAVHAQFAERIAVRGELGLGTMLASRQQDALGFGLGLQGTLRVAITLFDPLAVQISGGSWLFPADGGSGGVLPFTGGLRFEPRIGAVGRLFVDANAGVSLTGRDARFGFDAGVGFEFALLRVLHIGPVLRYGHVLADESVEESSDAKFWSAGLSVALRVPRAEAAPTPTPTPTDADGDGVLDAEDLCPTTPRGDHPDAARMGCPQGDTDRDGVVDGDDQCPTTPAGTAPDPGRRGCPRNDADGDGVFDTDDRCPTTPCGATPDATRAGCPDPDDDNDGVRNGLDQCPTQHHGATPDPARAGCPAPDRDGDSVPDASDACPDRPGAPSPDARRHGCPGLVVVEGGLIRINRPVFFANNSDRILPRSNAVLQAVADTLRLSPGIRRVAVEGHTDDRGNADANLALSQRRAESVVRWLTEHGVVAGRLEAHGYGPNRPMVPNTNGRNRARNRRVEFHITDPAR